MTAAKARKREQGAHQEVHEEGAQIDAEEIAVGEEGGISRG